MSISPDCTLTSKQQSVLLVLWPCLKAPPRIDIQIGPEGIRLGATFDRTAPGMVFESVKLDPDQIAVAATLDVTAVEIDFETLKVAAGLESAEEAAEVWGSIKYVVSSASATTVARRYARDAGEKVPPWDSSASRPSLVEQLYTAARDVQNFAYKARLNEVEAQLEPVSTTAAAKFALNERWNRYTENDRLRMVKYDLERASSPHIMKHIRALTAWFVQRLFGDRGLESFYSSQRERAEQYHAKGYMALPAHRQEREPPSNMMDRVLDSYQRICDSATVEAHGEAYRDRLRLYACFFDQMTSLRRKFWQKGSAEQRALLQYAGDKAASTTSESTRRLKPKLSLQQVAWEWLPEQTCQSRSTVDDAVWKGRQLRTMIALFGDGVLYFMDSHLETE